MRGLWAKLHRSILGNALPMLKVKSTVLLIVSRLPNEPSSI